MLFRAMASLLVFDDRLAGHGIDHRVARAGIDLRHLAVLEEDLAGLHAVARLAQAAGGEEALLGEVLVFAGLPDDAARSRKSPS